MLRGGKVLKKSSAHTQSVSRIAGQFSFDVIVLKRSSPSSARNSRQESVVRDDHTRQVVYVAVLATAISILLFGLMYFAPEYPNSTQQSAISTLQFICGGSAIILIKELQRLLTTRRRPTTKRDD